MMIDCHPHIPQDTITGRNIVLKDSGRHALTIIPKIEIISQPDTTSVCARNIIADVTFYDSANIVAKIETESFNRFPYNFIEKNKQINSIARASLVKNLREGQDLPSQPLHEDWIIGVILISAFLYSIIQTKSTNTILGGARFFLFRGISDPSSRDTSSIFYWQSTILNFISFLIIGLFAFCTASFFDIIPSGIKGIVFWLLAFSSVVAAVTLRHIVCVFTGKASGEKEIFREYLVSVYQFYKFSALLLFITIILMSYTVLLPVRVGIISGGIVLGIMYFIRVLRLLIIFINRNISIFYLILYLCGLEILPVLISIKYFSGLV